MVILIILLAYIVLFIKTFSMFNLILNYDILILIKMSPEFYNACMVLFKYVSVLSPF